VTIKGNDTNPNIDEELQKQEQQRLDNKRKIGLKAAKRYREGYTRFQVLLDKPFAKSIRIKCIEEDIQVSEIIRSAFSLWLDDKIDLLPRDKNKPRAKREAAENNREAYTRFEVTVDKPLAKVIRIKCIEEDIQVTEIIRSAFALWLDGKMDLLPRDKNKPRAGTKLRLPQE
jgi:hypothetical protein